VKNKHYDIATPVTCARYITPDRYHFPQLWSFGFESFSSKVACWIVSNG